MFRNSTGKWLILIIALTMAVAAVPSATAQTTISQIQAMSGWGSCTTCAGASGSGTTALFSMVENQSSPSLTGRAAKFFLGGSRPYSDALWWKQLGTHDTATHFQYDVYFYLKTPQYAQSLEFDVNHKNGHRWFIFGTQCSARGSHTWEVWDGAAARWISTGIGCSAPSAYKWHHLTWHLYRDSTYTHFVSLTLDGVTHYVNRAYAAR